MDKDITRGVRFGHDENANPSATSIPGSLKMEAWDYLAALPAPGSRNSILEVQFKNTHKDYYLNPEGLDVRIGDIVVVESQPGIDIGVVTMEEDMVRRKMRCSAYRGNVEECRKVLRRPNRYDIERWQEAISMENDTMIRSRRISVDLGLEMKIGDVEYQADKLKAIFYYIADGRVDFRELIKVLADQFRIRVEMRQIGARQEAGRIGGIGSCGRELCCSSWHTSFSSVSINAARMQDITPNPQKLAGQCGKLKCCLNYEADVYEDAKKNIPNAKQPLEAMDGLYYLVRSDALRQVMWFTTDPQSQAVQIPLSVMEVRKIQEMNRRGEKPDTLSGTPAMHPKTEQDNMFENVVGQDSLTRFDKTKTKNRKKGKPQKPAHDKQPDKSQGKSQGKPQDKPQDQKVQKAKRRQDGKTSEPKKQDADRKNAQPSQENAAGGSRKGNRHGKPKASKDRKPKEENPKQ